MKAAQPTEITFMLTIDGAKVVVLIIEPDKIAALMEDDGSLGDLLRGIIATKPTDIPVPGKA